MIANFKKKLALDSSEKPILPIVGLRLLEGTGMREDNCNETGWSTVRPRANIMSRSWLIFFSELSESVMDRLGDRRARPHRDAGCI